MPADPARTHGMSGTQPAEVLIGREAWVRALREALRRLPALDPQPRDLLLWSCDFCEWPLDEAPVLQALTDWLRGAGHRMRFIGHDFEATSRRHPRLARWHRDWSHRIEAWRPTAPLEGEPTGLLLCGDRLWQLLDNVHWRTRTVSDAPMLRAWREQSDACLQRCEPAWPATTLGL